MNTLSFPDRFDRARYAPLKEAVNALAEVCDGAQEKDDQGFDGTDTRGGHLYAFLPQDAWPLCAFHRAWRWTKKYHRQLEAMGINCSDLPEPPQFADEDRQIALKEGSGYYVVFPNYDWDLINEFRSLPGNAIRRVPIGANGKLFFRYRTYEGPGSVLLEWARSHRFRLGPGVAERAQMPDEEAAAPAGGRVVFEKNTDSFALYFSERLLNAEVKQIPYRSYSNEGGFHWLIGARRDAVGPLRAFLNRHNFVVPPEAERRMRELEEDQVITRANLYR
jgi:hypothetical protein